MNLPHYSDGRQWDNRIGPAAKRYGLNEYRIEIRCPWLCPTWTGPTNPHQARACDAAMVQLGEILAAHRDWYTVMRISAAANRLRKAGE